MTSLTSIRLHLQDTYSKLVDSSITLASRSYENTPPSRRWASNGVGSGSRRESNILSPQPHYLF